MPTEKKQLIVLGGGPGGYVAAFHAADRGIETILVDPGPNPGGVCLFRGCIPSKALLHVAKLIEESREAKSWGVTFGEPQIEIERLREWKNEVVGKLTGGLGQLAKQRKVEHVRGWGRLDGPESLIVKMEDGSGERTYSFEHLIIATGSLPIVLPGWPEHDRILDSTSGLELPEVPKTMLVVGGGYIGLELGSVYAALGTKVSVVEMTAGLLPGADRDLVRPLQKRLKNLFEGIHLETKVAAVEPGKKSVKVRFEGKDAGKARAEYDYVLVSVGRKPVTSGLGLESTKVKITDRGFIEIDGQRRTAEPSIYAIGDVAGNPMLAHKASHEGRVAVDAIAGDRGAEWDVRAIPAAVFTDPEIAWAGLMEDEAKAAGLEFETARFPWAASGRSITLDRTDGVTKLVVEKESKRVIGVGICGPGAGELIAEACLAIEMGCTADDLRMTIHPHPTLSETVMEAADLIFNESAHYAVTRKKG